MTVLISPTDDIDACHKLRFTVFCEEQGVDWSLELDDLDAVSTHLLATEAGVPVGTARVFKSGPYAKIGRVCVLPGHRGTGLGAKLIVAALELGKTLPDVTAAKLGAQVQAIGFYEKLGFEISGPLYDDAGIPHRDMTRPY
ncbi:putative N-acetyltransferase YjcF [Aquimixticola soesokkakensis]|uniref:Putative N-acetyltransferase YjcF n=1 Tax=Aquimixticola soesokkakensis TaxID=1519096 RepID=A0A1Y5RGR0_9RHOB|nr:GNAT family N-acetyltransferase [Aquimixticola soesokkakensis]SLN14474.1 putative N-acetyltransferase YjcF [Aquimixticola soesokkakensis]